MGIFESNLEFANMQRFLPRIARTTRVRPQFRRVTGEGDQGRIVTVPGGSKNFRGYEMPVTFAFALSVVFFVTLGIKTVSNVGDPKSVRSQALPKCGDYYGKPEWRRKMS